MSSASYLKKCEESHYNANHIHPTNEYVQKYTYEEQHETFKPLRRYLVNNIFISIIMIELIFTLSLTKPLSLFLK